MRTDSLSAVIAVSYIVPYVSWINVLVFCVPVAAGVALAVLYAAPCFAEVVRPDKLRTVDNGRTVEQNSLGMDRQSRNRTILVFGGERLIGLGTVCLARFIIANAEITAVS